MLRKRLLIHFKRITDALSIGTDAFKAADGKKYLTDVANPETLLRLIQSVPSPKAEPSPASFLRG